MRQEFGSVAPQPVPHEKPKTQRPHLEVLPGGHADDEVWEAAIERAHTREANEEAEWERKRNWAHREAENEKLRQKIRASKEDRAWEAAIAEAHEREDHLEQQRLSSENVKAEIAAALPYLSKGEQKSLNAAEAVLDTYANDEATRVAYARDILDLIELYRDDISWTQAIDAAHQREENLETQRLSNENIQAKIESLTPYLSPKQREAIEMAGQYLETITDETARRSYAEDILDWIEVFTNDPNTQLQKMAEKNPKNKWAKKVHQAPRQHLRGTPKSELNEPNPARTVSPSKTKTQKVVDWLKS